MARLLPSLDWLLGSRTWCVIDDDGFYFAAAEADPDESRFVVLAKGLRKCRAEQLVLSLTFGEEGWSVWSRAGTYFAEMGWLPTDDRPGMQLVQAGLRRRVAERLAAKLRNQDENTPRDII